MKLKKTQTKLKTNSNKIEHKIQMELKKINEIGNKIQTKLLKNTN
jgi:hypothetical protein